MTDQPEELDRFPVDGTDVSIAPFDDGIIAITDHGTGTTVTVPAESATNFLLSLHEALRVLR